MEIKEMGYVSSSSWQHQCIYERKIEKGQIGLHSSDRFSGVNLAILVIGASHEVKEGKLDGPCETVTKSPVLWHSSSRL